MTSDKFIYLFGRVIPKLSLLLSMVLNFVPKFKQHFKEIDQSQKALGIYASNSYVDKAVSYTHLISQETCYIYRGSSDLVKGSFVPHRRNNYP